MQEGLQEPLQEGLRVHLQEELPEPLLEGMPDLPFYQGFKTYSYYNEKDTHMYKVHMYNV